MHTNMQTNIYTLKRVKLKLGLQNGPIGGFANVPLKTTRHAYWVKCVKARE